jgi:ketosteroid isomerase-like protein
MSRENVDIIRELFERANRQDETLLDDFYDPDAVWHSRADEPDTGVYEGREAIRELWRMWASGAPVREPYAWVTRLRDGKVIEVREYRDKAEALEAAGL